MQLTQTFNASKERVFRAFTDEVELAAWHGGPVLTTVTNQVPGERLEGQAPGPDQSPTTVTLTFADHPSGSELTVTLDPVAKDLQEQAADQWATNFAELTKLVAPPS